MWVQEVKSRITNTTTSVCVCVCVCVRARVSSSRSEETVVVVACEAVRISMWVARIDLRRIQREVLATKLVGASEKRSSSRRLSMSGRRPKMESKLKNTHVG